MNTVQIALTIAVCALGTIATRMLPFALFSGGRKTPAVVAYLGKALPAAIFGMLVVYCLRSVDWTTGTHGLPEAIAIAVTAGLHIWKKQTLLSVAGGTICYMLLVQLVF